MISIPGYILSLALAAPLLAPETQAPYRAVCLISVDGLRSDALLALPQADLPNFARLQRGAFTLNARTDPDWTITLPNHTAMITGRFVAGDAGHAWTGNGEPKEGHTLHTEKRAYVSGIFDVAHDRGLYTALFTGKTKFSLYDTSWNAANGADDAFESDQGRDKLDLYVCEPLLGPLVDRVLETLTANEAQKLLFLHMATPDWAGHAKGWDLTPGSEYMKAVQGVDLQLGRLLDTIEAAPSLRTHTAIVLTTDHGGGAPLHSHDQEHMWVDYIIPFIVWTGDAALEHDLYKLNAGVRADPSLGRPLRDATGAPPIRNGDAANLVLELLGLPAVPGSTLNARQELEWQLAPPVK